MSIDEAETRARRRRARQLVIGAAIVVVVMAIVGVIGSHLADSRAAQQRDKLARALAHLSIGDAGLAPFNGQLARIDAEVGGEHVNWEGATGPTFSQSIVGWWFWAPRCVVGVVGTSGATVTVSSGRNCPPAPSGPPGTAPPGPGVP